jgi:hypothetical protein
MDKKQAFVPAASANGKQTPRVHNQLAAVCRGGAGCNCKVHRSSQKLYLSWATVQV